MANRSSRIELVGIELIQGLSFETRIVAEARIDLIELNGLPAIIKIRIPKVYRNESLDKRLRKSRTKAEVELLHAAKLAGVSVPEVFHANPEESEIIMEFVNGTLLKDIKDGKLGRTIFETVGAYAARMHKKGIIHGDITTKNVIYFNESTRLIDFGLAFFSDRLEDKSEDMHLLKQAIMSSGLDPSVYFESALRGYKKESGSKASERLRRQILEIERRGRYARVD